MKTNNAYFTAPIMKGVINMLKIVKNNGQIKVKRLKKCKYVLYTDEFGVGELYAKVGLKSIFWYVVAKIKGETYRP